ncbi:hypothetical protein VB715_08375 [Crocosphaera sp. UHCC 0190]|uniref:hypothetical protein n=1 Tax=Crocosphaera sp. UHCC 0190 TaxID=3110246 RepID=UPI002B1F35D2|nr:hypothetical protein [Crocosphaera sp. UHCC 0190]MEA5509778.1 hypothetical protein [Crocosphaera sp. UHCC 0190]
MTLPNSNAHFNELNPRVIRTRSLEFDILKTLGIFCIILAHTLPKTEVFIYQLRNFDVPLMVIVSGALFWMTSSIGLIVCLSLKYQVLAIFCIKEFL